MLYKSANNKYTKQIPANKTSINELVVAYPQALAGNAVEAVELVVTMNSNIASTTLVNRFSVEHSTAAGIKKTISNDAITNIGGHSDVSNNTGDYSSIIGTGSLKKPLYFCLQRCMQCNTHCTG